MGEEREGGAVVYQHCGQRVRRKQGYTNNIMMTVESKWREGGQPTSSYHRR
jgi:hypothetical protein